MNDSRQRWFYTVWIILQSLLYIGLMLLQHLDSGNAQLLIRILQVICFADGCFLLLLVMRKTERSKQPEDPSVMQDDADETPQ